MAVADMPNSRVFLDIDLDSHREKYQRARDFVEATDLRYGWTSKDIAELGGGEKQRVVECYADDFDWGSKGPIEIESAAEKEVVIELFDDKAPLAVENFKALCTGEKNMSKNCAVPYHYKGVKFHRVVKGFMMQGGDFAMQNGSGGESIWGKKFKDEKDGLKGRHDARGVVAMGNTGKNSNGSQFFITFAPCKQLDGKHVVFGKVVEGMSVIDKVEAVAVAPGGVTEEPTVPRSSRTAGRGFFYIGPASSNSEPNSYSQRSSRESTRTSFVFITREETITWHYRDERVRHSASLCVGGHALYSGMSGRAGRSFFASVLLRDVLDHAVNLDDGDGAVVGVGVVLVFVWRREERRGRRRERPP